MREHINLLLLVKELTFHLSSGLSLRSAISEFSQSNLSIKVKNLVFNFDRGVEINKNHFGKGILLETAVDVLIVGLSGYPIIKYLKKLEEQLFQQIEVDLQSKVQQLPVKVLIPVLFLMLPAYLIVMIGPILKQLLEVW